MKKMISLLISLIFLTSESKADVTYLLQDTKAPFTGYLFSADKATEMQKELQICDDMKLQIDSFNKSIDLYKANEKLYNDKVNLLTDQNGKLITLVNEEYKMSRWEEAGWFVLGMVTVSAGLYLGRRM